MAKVISSIDTKAGAVPIPAKVKIVPNKLIIDTNNDGTFKQAILQYRLKVDGSLYPKYYSISVGADMDLDSVGKILKKAKKSVATAENVADE